ncbi:suppressor of cytokine signaling 2 [Rhinophrynus dorsalis]
MTLRSPDTADSPDTIHSGSGQGGSPPGSTKEGTDKDDRITLSMGELRRSGWYWGNMTVSEAKEKLQDAPEGTFLVRDSSHTDYLLTISVKTSAGPTNLRIEYREGKFRLDSVVCVRSRLKQFDSVVHLIEYYVLLSKNKKIESETLPNRTVHLWLVKPLYTSTPSLQHLCRMTVNKCTKKIHELPLPMRLKEYITEYRYHV